MERLRPSEYDALLKAIERIYEVEQADDFSLQALKIVKQLVPSTHSSYNEIPRARFLPQVNGREPLMGGMTFPLVELSVHIRQTISKFIHQHPFTAYFKKTNDGRTCKTSDFLKRDQFHRLELYNEYYRKIGTEYQMGFWLKTSMDNATSISFTLSRGKKDFSERDRLVLELMRPHFDRVLRDATIRTQFKAEQAALESAIEQEGKGVIQVGADGRISYITSFAGFLLTSYFGSSSQQKDRLPLLLEQWLRENLSADRMMRNHRPLTLEKEGKTLFVQCLHTERSEYTILILRELENQATPTEKSVESFGLTVREGHVLHWVAMGKTNHEIGVILNISIGTVKKHLEHIYAKLGVENRISAASAYQNLFSKR